jgi:hypothetical protein
MLSLALASQAQAAVWVKKDLIVNRCNSYVVLVLQYYLEPR